MLEHDLTTEVELHDGVDVPTRAGAGHRVLRTQASPSEVETLLVTVDVLEREIRMLGVE
jgi:hypothetical protein